MFTSTAKRDHIAFCSGGRDSVATLIVAKNYNEPLDAVAFVEVMFDRQTSGEHPLHRDFVYERLKPFVENELRVPFIVLRSDRTYMDRFDGIVCRGENKGKTRGFPVPGMCAINRDCKMRAINVFRKSRIIEREYVGIRADEPKRLARLDGKNKVSLLAKYNHNKASVTRLCLDHGLLSPVYDIARRNGCWFCMNCGDCEWVWLAKNRPDLFDRLIDLEKTPNLYRRCLTRNETPSQIRQRISVCADQISLFD